MGQFKMFLARGKNRGSDEIIQIVTRNKFIAEIIDKVDINSRDDLEAYRLKGVPAINGPGYQTKYGSEAIELLNQLIKKNRPVVGGSCDGVDFVALGDDDEVGFDPSRIKGPEDFVIPDAPMGNGDIDSELARQKANRELFDAELGSRGRH